MAQAMGQLLRQRGVPIAGVTSRNRNHAREAARFIGPDVEALDSVRQLLLRCDTLLIAVSDDAVSRVAEVLADAGMSKGVAIHTAGVHGPQALRPLAERGVSCGSLHPLQTVSTPEQGVSSLPEAWYAVAAEGRAAEVARAWVSLLGGRLLSINSNGKPLYHAAAVMASNGTIALLSAAVELMQAAGVTPDRALQALAPLVSASLENALSQGPTAALTGPVERGDARTIGLHQAAMDAARMAEEIRDLYLAAGLQAARMAAVKGLDPDRVRAVRRALKGAVDEAR